MLESNPAAKESHTMHILFLGDSIGADPAYSFVPMVIGRLRKLRDEGLDVVNSSVDSSNVFDALDRAQELLAAQRFDVVVVFIGVNDTKILAHIGEALVPRSLYAHTMEMLVRRCEMNGARVFVCGLPDLAFKQISRSEFLKPYWTWDVDAYHTYDASLREIVAKAPMTRTFIDLEAEFAAGGNPRESLFRADGVHPNQRGADAIAEAIARSLDPI